ncbi:MAG: nicotinamide mononucleotide transporter [Desulfovibrionaceae bacterium]|jgi:nicotinamide riboside transporter PnuC|nr:nicotinamide mononucleotide transporter [Desulfovibrionaceae bacterium]
MEQLTWLFTALSILGVVLNVRKDRRCFPVWIVANVGWVVTNLRHGIYSQAVLFVVYTGLSVWGYVAWSRKAPGGAAGE